MDTSMGTQRVVTHTGFAGGPQVEAWARWAALQVADLWECPSSVRQYLETGEGRESACEAIDMAARWEGRAEFEARCAAAGAASGSYASIAWAVSVARPEIEGEIVRRLRAAVAASP